MRALTQLFEQIVDEIEVSDTLEYLVFVNGCPDAHPYHSKLIKDSSQGRIHRLLIAKNT